MLRYGLIVALFGATMMFANPCDDLERKLIHKEAEVEVLIEFYEKFESQSKWRNIGEAVGGILLAVATAYGIVKKRSS